MIIQDNVKKTLAFFIPDFSIGGVEKAFLCFASALSDAYDVSFIVIHNSGTLRNEVSPGIRIHNLFLSRLKYAFFPLCKLLKMEKFDYVVAGTETTNTLVVFANILAGMPSKIVTSQHNYDDIESSFIIHKYLLPWVHKHAYHTYAVSKGIANMLYGMGLKKEHVTLLYNPINVQEIQKKALEPHKEFQLPEKYIVFVGRLYPVKNLSLLLRSFQLFAQSNSDYFLVIVGDGEEREKMEKLSKKIGIDKNTIFVGATCNPYPYIAKAQILALTSFMESLSIVTLEAICLGKTVISTPCRGPEEIIQYPKYGYISNNFTDEREFCSIMQQAVDNPISRNLLSDYVQQYNIESALKIFKSMII